MSHHSSRYMPLQFQYTLYKVHFFANLIEGKLLEEDRERFDKWFVGSVLSTEPEKKFKTKSQALKFAKSYMIEH